MKKANGREVAEFHLCWGPSITIPQNWGEILQHKGRR